MILDSSFPPDPRVENEAVSLIEDGHKIHLYSIDYTKKLPLQEKINGIHVHRSRFSKHIYSFSALAYTLPYYHYALLKSLRKFIKENNIAILHIHDIQVARSVFLVNKEFNLPIVLDLHENRPEIMKFYYHVNSRLGKLLISPSTWKKFEFKYIKEADHVITVTEEASEYYVKQLGVDRKKFCIVPNTVRKAFFTDHKINNDILSRFENHFTLLYLGETGTRRGLLTVLESLEYLIPKIPNIKILIVGKSKEDYVLSEFVEKHNYQEYVKFEGWQNFQLFQSYILASDVGICPIHKNLHHDTTYANKLFQYMAFGKPIVVSDCTSQENLVKKYNCGLVFEDRNAKDFANTVISIAGKNELYKKLSQNAENTVKEHLNWEITSQGLKKLYKDEGNKKK